MIIFFLILSFVFFFINCQCIFFIIFKHTCINLTFIFLILSEPNRISSKISGSYYIHFMKEEANPITEDQAYKNSTVSSKSSVTCPAYRTYLPMLSLAKWTPSVTDFITRERGTFTQMEEIYIYIYIYI